MTSHFSTTPQLFVGTWLALSCSGTSNDTGENASQRAHDTSTESEGLEPKGAHPFEMGEPKPWAPFPEENGGASLEAGGSGGIQGTPSDLSGGTSGIALGPGCEGRDFILCEDFEREILEGGPFQAKGSIELSEVRSVSGSRALRISADGNRGHGGKLFLEGEAVSPFASGFFGRAWMYFTGETPHTHTDLVFAGSDTWWRYGVEANVFAGNWWGSAGEGAFPSDRWFTDRDRVPVNQWFCLEWQFDRVGNDMRLWLDGVEHPELRRAVSVPGGEWPVPAFERIEVGLEIFGENAPLLVDFDDIALDDEKVGCQ